MTIMEPITTLMVDLTIFMRLPLGHKLKTPNSSIPLRRLMSSSPWMGYEVGKLTQEECFAQLVDLYGIQTDELVETVAEYQSTINYDHDTASIFNKLKTTSQIKIILISNIAKTDYDAIRQRWDEGFWSIFDHVFTSEIVGVRKPSPRFFRHVLRATRSSCHEVFMVDERPEDVLVARSMGIPGTFCTNDLGKTLANAIGNPVERGLAFLQRNAKSLPTTDQDGLVINEVYASLLILEVMQDASLVDIQPPSRLWNFFSGKPKYTSDEYPEDLDTTSLGLATIPYESIVVHSILDEMLNYVDEDGFVMIYFDKSRPRVDVVIALNVLTIFYKYGRGYELPETEDWIHRTLLNRAYIDGTRYYSCAEWFLYYLTRLLHTANSETLREKFEQPLRVRAIERIGAAGDAFCLGMRLLACNYLGVENIPDRERLKSMQLEDGGWAPSYMYYFPGASREVGNRGTTTAFAVQALRGWPGKHYS